MQEEGGIEDKRIFGRMMKRTINKEEVNMMETPRRNLSLDLLRIIACFLVILYHSRGLNHDSINGTPLSVFNAACGFGAFFFGRLGVPLFLMIGGYFAFQPESSTFTFLKKRLGRVVIPTLFWLLLSTLLIGGTNDFFNNVWHLKCAGHLWYMYTLIGILFLIPVVNPFLQKATKKELVLYVGIWALTLILNGNYFDVFKNYELTHSGMSGSNPAFAFISFYGFFGYYLLGFIAAKYSIKKKYVCVMAVGSILLWLFTAIVCHVGLYGSWFYLSIPVALLSFALILIFKNLNISNLYTPPYLLYKIKTMSYLTFGIYLVHIVVLDFLSKINFFNHANVLITACVVFVISLFITWGVSLLPIKQYIIG